MLQQHSSEVVIAALRMHPLSREQAAKALRRLMPEAAWPTEDAAARAKARQKAAVAVFLLRQPADEDASNAAGEHSAMIRTSSVSSVIAMALEEA